MIRQKHIKSTVLDIVPVEHLVPQRQHSLFYRVLHDLKLGTQSVDRQMKLVVLGVQYCLMIDALREKKYHEAAKHQGHYLAIDKCLEAKGKDEPSTNDLQDQLMAIVDDSRNTQQPG